MPTKVTTRITYQITNKPISTLKSMDTSRIPDMPMLKRGFPTRSEFLIPLRMSSRNYRTDGGVVPISDEYPETDSNEISTGRMYAMSVVVPICGHATRVGSNDKDDGTVMVCEPVYAHTNINSMGNGIRAVYGGPLKWINMYGGRDINPETPSNRYMIRASNVYRDHGPLCVYTNVAVTEATNHSGGSDFWRSLYPPMELISCHYSPWGVIEDNTLVSLGDVTGSDEMCTIENRRPRDDHDGFLDPYYTPQSKASGRVRLLTAGVTVRVMTTETITMAIRIMSAASHQIGNGFGDWVLRCGGFTTSVSGPDVDRMMNVWRNMNQFNMPTMHVFRSAKVVVISIVSGVLIRPVRLSVVSGKFVMEGPFVDSMCVHHSDTMSYLDTVFPKSGCENEQLVCAVARCVPFSAFATEPRTGLGIGMMPQTLSTHSVKGDATITSLGTNDPVAVTEFMDALSNSNGPECEVMVPGRNVVMAFINTQTNTEDACDVMSEFAEWGSFAWMGTVDYPLPNVCSVGPGTVLSDQPWWKPAFTGIVVRTYVNRNAGMNAVVYLYKRSLEIGDKLVTWHGIKFTVGSLVPYKSMYTLVNTVTGENIKPTMLVSTKTLARGPGGQIREMNVYTNAYKTVTDFRRGGPSRRTGPITISEEFRTRAELPEAYVTMNGNKIEFKDTDGTTRMVKCNYGIARVMQVRHMPVLKQHYPSEVIRSIEVPRGRYRSGTPRMSETELISMMMQNLIRNVSDAVQSSGFSDFTKCSVCHAVPTYCDCPSPKPPTTQAATMYAALKLNEFATKAMLNDEKGNPLTLRFYTTDPS